MGIVLTLENRSSDGEILLCDVREWYVTSSKKEI